MPDYPFTNTWKSIAVVTITTTAAPALLATDLAVAGDLWPSMRVLGFYADGDVVYGGKELTTLGAAAGFPLVAGQTLWEDVARGLGFYWRTASGSTTLRVLIGFE